MKMLCGRLSQSRIRGGGRMSEKPLVSEILPQTGIALSKDFLILFKATMPLKENFHPKIKLKMINGEKPFSFTLTSLKKVTFVSWILEKRCLCVLWKRLDLSCRLCDASLNLKGWRNVWAFIIQTTVNVWLNKPLKSRHLPHKRIGQNVNGNRSCSAQIKVTVYEFQKGKKSSWES